MSNELRRFGSLDTIDDPIDIGLGGLTLAKNVDIDLKGRVSTRVGRMKVFNGTIEASLSDGGMLLFLSGGVMFVGTESGIEPLGCDDVITGTYIAAAMVAGNIYFNTGDYQGVIIGQTIRRMGVPLPDSLSVSIISGSSLLAGRYQFTASLVAPDGRESGVQYIQYVDILDNEGFVVNVGVPVGFTANIYVSGCNGTELFYAGTGANMTFVQPSQTMHVGYPLPDEYNVIMPCGQLMVFSNGRILSAVDNLLYVSNALNYEACDIAKGVIPMNGRITMLTAVDFGVFIGDSSGIWFLTGSSPEDFQIKLVDYSLVIEGSACKLDMSKMGAGNNTGNAVIFVTNKGAIKIGLPSGQSVNPVTDREVYINPPEPPVAAAIVDGKYMVTRMMWPVVLQSYSVTPPNDRVCARILPGNLFSIDITDLMPIVNGVIISS